MKKVLLVVFGLLLALVLLNASCTGSSQTADLVKDVKTEHTYVNAAVNGCVAKGLLNKEAMMAILMSGGQVCNQLVGGVLNRTIENKHLCSNASDIQKCLYLAGYVRMAAATGALPKTPDEIATLDQEAQTAYTKFRQEMDARQ